MIGSCSATYYSRPHAGERSSIVKLRYLALALIGLLVVTSTQVQAARLFGATASGSPGRLYEIDPATGSVIQDIGPLNDGGGTNYPMTGLAFHPQTGVLYGSTGNNPDTTAALLVTINPLTAQVSVIGTFNTGQVNGSGTPATMADLAFDRRGNLYGIGSIGGPQLYSIDIGTAQATVIGNSGLTSTGGGGLVVTANGVFYGTPTPSRYGTYDPTTGVYTNITNPVKPGGGGSYAALDVTPGSGVIYGLNSAPGSPPPAFLAIIDGPTGTVTTVGQTAQALDSIAFEIPEPASVALGLMVAMAGAALRRR
jgi:hypothetical protein